MKDKLIKLLENSYSPYSHFRVSAIVVMNPFGETFNKNYAHIHLVRMI